MLILVWGANMTLRILASLSLILLASYTFLEIQSQMIGDRNKDFISYDNAVNEYNNSDNVNMKLLALSKIRNLDFSKYGYSVELDRFHSCMIQETKDHNGLAFNDQFVFCKVLTNE